MTRLGPQRRLWVTLISLLVVLSPTGAFIDQSGGGYLATTDVTDTLLLALDIRDMRAAASDFTLKKQIYQNGTHAAVTLSQLSTSAEHQWHDTPLFNLYRSGFTKLGTKQEHDTLGDFDGAPAAEYADRLVLDLFDLELPHIEGDGAVVYNVLMAFWGMLFQTLHVCLQAKDGLDKDNGISRMHSFLDQAAALWVGAAQERGQSDTGYMLYNLAQLVGERFDQNDLGSEVRLNTLVLDTLVEIQNKINKNECVEIEGYVAMRRQVMLLVKYSNTVVVQQLLNVLEEDNSRKPDYVEMYTLALLPQIASCDSAAYYQLLHHAVAESITDDAKASFTKTLQNSYSCLLTDCELVGAYEGSRIPQCTDDADPTTGVVLAGYPASSDVRQRSRLDRDVAYIRIFMEWNAYGSAQDVYMFGWNTEQQLQELTQDLAFAGIDPVQNFRQYFGSETKYEPDNIIMNALQKAEPFATASDQDRQAVVAGALTGTMYWAMSARMINSRLACTQGDFTSAKDEWDAAVAYYVGSAEGSSQYGQEGGQFLFALSKEVCESFGTCEPESSVSDVKVMVSLKAGASLLEKQQCQELEKLITDTINSQILVTMLQATILSAVRADRGSLLALSRAVVPEINQADPTSATTIDQNSNFFFSSPTINLEAFFGAIAASLPGMVISCNDVGKLTAEGLSRGFCPGDVTVGTLLPQPAPQPTVQQPSPPVSPTAAPTGSPIFVPDPHEGGIAWGLYQFSDSQAAENDSKFSLDVKAMFLANSPTQAALVYNATVSPNVPSGLYGQEEIRNLQEFSTRVSRLYAQDPMYAFYRVALYEDESFDDVDNANGWPFADSVVQLALAPENGNDAKLGAQVAVAMNIWMMIVHRLYEAVRNCKQGTKSVDLIDAAVGLWIGQEQAHGKFNSGWSVYALAQIAAKLFGQPEREARVNTQLISLFGQAKNTVNLCAVNDESSYLKLRFLVDDIVRKLSTPLLQNLLYYMSVDNFEYVELYALSFIPQVLSCNEGTYDFLKDVLYENFVRADAIDDNFLDQLGSALSCLRFTCEDLGEVSGANDDLESIVDELCYRLDNSRESLLVAGYQLSELVFQLDRVDLDVHQIDLFMRVEAYDLATDVYEYGRNSFLDEDEEAANSLRDLVETMPSLDTEDLFGVYSEYFKTPNFAQQNVISALGRGQSGRFANASRRQLSEVVVRTSQVMISYIHVIGRLRSAVKSCVDDAGGQDEVDEAVALFVGSMEGRSSGGDLTNNGKMMFALAKEVCEAFNKCESHGDATSNEFLMFAFDDMKQYLDTSECEKARSVLEGSILPMLQVPLVQGTLHFAYKNQNLLAQTSNASLAAGDIISGSILPYVDIVNKTSAALIAQNMEFNRSAKPVSGGATAVFAAFASALGAMDVDCSSIGQLAGLSVCTADAVPHPSTPTNLGEDLYVTTTYVQDRANIALDIKEMEELLADGTEDQAALVYKEGRNSEIYDKFGKRLGRRSLSGFATDASVANPLYTIAVFALADKDGKYRGRDAWLYPDTIVQEELARASQITSTLAADAAVALNVWMELAKELHETVTRCKNKNITDDDGVHSIDEAVAYWIGDGQIAGDGERGHLLYALAERMGDHFGLDDGGQSRTNVNILRLFHEASIELSLPNACSESPTTAKRVRRIVDKISSHMVIVNVQALIHSLRTDDRASARVYAHGVVPLVVACNPTTFDYLRGKLIDADFQAQDVEDIVQAIYSTFPCFDIQCDDIGVHETEEKSTCVDLPQRSALAGYTPSSDVRKVAKIDLDILEIGILLGMNAHEAALDLYSYGKHATTGDDNDRTALSLNFLATSSGRSVVPQFEAFRRYFNGSEKYADILVQSAITDAEFNIEQRRAMVVDVCRFMIMYMAALQAMYEAVSACQKGDGESQVAALEYWDIAAAFIIGHLEGTAEGGSGEGLLLWGLAKKNCLEFGTCSPEVEGSSLLNDKIATLLYAGRGGIVGGNCFELKRATTEIEPLLATSLIQASLSEATTLTKNKELSTRPLAQVKAYTYALSVLPLIAETDRGSADTIAANLNKSGIPVSGGLASVATAFSRPLDMIGVDCTDVGVSTEIDPCTGVVYEEEHKSGLIAGILIGTLAAILMCFVFRRRRRRAKRTEQEKNEFLAPKGELNHASELTPEQPMERTGSADTDSFVEHDADAASGEHEDDDQYVEAVAETKASNIV